MAKKTGTSGFLCVSDSDRRVPAELGQESQSPDTPGSPEGNTEGPGTASSEPLLPS